MLNEMFSVFAVEPSEEQVGNYCLICLYLKFVVRHISCCLESRHFCCVCVMDTNIVTK